jgi:hypothetical protein
MCGGISDSRSPEFRRYLVSDFDVSCAGIYEGPKREREREIERSYSVSKVDKLSS